VYREGRLSQSQSAAPAVLNWKLPHSKQQSRPGGRVSPSRSVAYAVLRAVDEGAYASDTLAERSSGLASRDAGLASQIVFGCLRFQGQLDFLVEQYSGRAAAGLDKSVLIALRMAIFQLRYLDRIPAHAAVDETVEAVKQQKPPAAGFVNAVLRKVNRDEIAWPDRQTELSCPEWLMARWTEHFGAETTRVVAQAALREPVPYVRIAPGKPIPEGIEVEPTDLSGCYRLLNGSVPGLRLHDIGSQSIVPLLELAPEMAFLDLCAAPGNKTAQALETPLTLAVACDVSLARIREIPSVCPRVVLDATGTLPFSRLFDRIFIDAPCSGTGTLGRNPEIKWRVQPETIEKFAEKQLRLLAGAVERLKSEGRLVYATCSLEREENEGVVRAALERESELRFEREVWRVPGRDEGDGFYAAVFSKRAAG
jgi:16S rRNA (cytosine967-C5)-methyltransferase